MTKARLISLLILAVTFSAYFGWVLRPMASTTAASGRRRLVSGPMPPSRAVRDGGSIASTRTCSLRHRSLAAAIGVKDLRHEP